MTVSSKATFNLSDSQDSPRPGGLWQAILRFWPTLLLLVVTLVFFWRIVFTGLVLMHGDILILYSTYRSYAADVLRTLHFPLWDPYLYAGVPFIANIQSAVLYPPNLIYLFLPITTALSVSLVGHIFFAGVSSYLFARRAVGVSQFGALVAALIFMFSGFFMGQAGHIVIITPAAWMPLVLLAFHNLIYRPSARNIILAGAALTMQMLGGQPQMLYYTVVILALYIAFICLWRRPSGGFIRLGLALALGVVASCAFGAAQLLPSLELTNQSYRSAASFLDRANDLAIPPEKLIDSLIPHLSGSLHEEWVGYVGVSGLLLSLVAVFFAVRSARMWFFLFVVAFALLLTLGSRTPLFDLLLYNVPGFSLFRVPSRWLVAYTLGIAMLSAMGADAMLRVVSRIKEQQSAFVLAAMRISIILLVMGDLYLSAQSLPISRPGPSSLYTEPRPGADYLAAHSGNSRVLSVMSLNVAQADEMDRSQRLSSVMGPKAVEEYLAYVRLRLGMHGNSLLASRIRILGGYDNGMLPTSDFLRLQQDWFSDQGVIPIYPSEDQLRTVYDPRLLSLLGVKYVVTAPRIPLTVDGIPFGLTDSLNMERLGPSSSVEVRPYKPAVADAIGIVSTLSDAAQIKQGEEIAKMEIITSDGRTQAVPLRAGIETAEWSIGSTAGLGTAAHGPARVVSKQWMGRDDVNLYFARISLPRPSRISAVRLHYVNSFGRLHVLGISSIDSGSGLAQELDLYSMEEVYRGEVSILENPNALSRAFAVHEVDVVEDVEKAYELIKDNTFDPSRTATVSKPIPIQPAPLGGKSDQVAIIADEPEKVEIQAKLGSTGLLVLSDAFYPGWKVAVDGQEQEIYRADGMFRGVPLEAGEHTVVFTYAPMSFYIGLVITLLSVGAAAILLLLGPRLKGRKGNIKS